MDSQKNPPLKPFHCVYHAQTGESTRAGAAAKARNGDNLSAFLRVFVTPEGFAEQVRRMFHTTRPGVLVVLR
jgi:hypothetical protein